MRFLMMPMKGTMRFVIRKQHKIANSIIVFYFVNMVHYFFIFKISPKMFFHSKTMFKNIAIRSVWMMRGIHTDISSGMSILSSFPVFRVSSRLKFGMLGKMLTSLYLCLRRTSISFIKSIRTFLRAKFTLTLSKSRLVNKEVFATFFARYFYHKNNTNIGGLECQC